MKIIHKHGEVSISLSQDEGRQMRIAAYIAGNIARNLSDPERSKALDTAAASILAAANEFTPAKAQKKLDQQDAQQPDKPTTDLPPDLPV